MSDTLRDRRIAAQRASEIEYDRRLSEADDLLVAYRDMLAAEAKRKWRKAGIHIMGVFAFCAAFWILMYWMNGGF